MWHIALATLVLGACAGTAGAITGDALLDQAVDEGPSSPYYGFWTTTRAQTFTVGIDGMLDHVEVRLQGGATATFEIHPTTNGVPVLGSSALASAQVSFDLASPEFVAVDFSAAQIQVSQGDVLAIVNPGGTTIRTGATPFWINDSSWGSHDRGSFYSTNDDSPDAYEDTTLSVGFRTHVVPGPRVPGTTKFDFMDQTPRQVHLYLEGTPCPTTGSNGFVAPDCEVYAADEGAVFPHPPLVADIFFTGESERVQIDLPPAELARYLEQHLGVTPVSNSHLSVTVNVGYWSDGALLGGILTGGTGDYYFDAVLPTPQGELDFRWHAFHDDLPFEGTVLVGTPFEKQVIASCRMEAQAGPPVDENAICFLQQQPPPAFSRAFSTLTVFAQKDATFPLEDYSPEWEQLDFYIAEAPASPPPVPVLGPWATCGLAATLVGARAWAGRAGRRGRSVRRATDQGAGHANG